MSGGVDSSVAAALLAREGWETIGVTMCLGIKAAPARQPLCCGEAAIEDARRTASHLRIRHYVLRMEERLRTHVIADFFREYLRGRTPNPCIRCNQYLKFDSLLKKAIAWGAPFLATGHYARQRRLGRRFELLKAKDTRKDQSYFLYRLGQEELRHLVFPLGGRTKEEVRALAERFGLPVAHKPESQEICFVPDGDYRAFLAREGRACGYRTESALAPGVILDRQGRAIGRHEGIANYTIGQRERIGIAAGHPLYVTAIDWRNNTISVGDRADACSRQFVVKDVHYTGTRLKMGVAVEVKIRYNHTQARCRLFPFGKRLKVVCDAAQFAVTPGQSAVFYEGDRVRGGAIIDRVLA